MAFNAENYVLPLEDYFQLALAEWNKIDSDNKQTWWTWETHDESGNKIPAADRMQHQYIKVIVPGAVIPPKADVEAKMLEMRNAALADLNAQNDKAKSGKAKLKALGLDDDEIAQMYPCGSCPDCIGS